MTNFLNEQPSTSVKEYEHQVNNIEHFPLLLRCASTLKIPKYSYQRAAPSTWRLEKFIQIRIKPYSGDTEIEIRTPNGQHAHRGMTIGNLRKAYKKTNKKSQ